MAQFANSQPNDVAASARYWLSFRRNNDWATLTDWSTIAVNTYYESKLAEMKARLEILLDERQSDYERRTQAQSMATDSIGAQMLIGLAAQQKLPRAVLPFIQSKIFDNPDITIRTQAKTYFSSEGSEMVYSAKEVSTLSADPLNGKSVFNSNCAACHKLYNAGGAVGPDLSFIADKLDNEQLINAIINPSASIVFGYEPWMINTTDNNSLFGFLISNNERAMTIRDVGGNDHTIEKSKIAAAKKQDRSIMPSAADMNLSQQDLADVSSFLRSLKH
jgi:putative heme-binding domain-containing protein